ncbi:MAG: MBL fold metallo-hydrolase [Alphaproteobacteria bacterium]|nr:MBL fold metallo-hydrolase [Alphaproteobacteria bacterium]
MTTTDDKSKTTDHVDEASAAPSRREIFGAAAAAGLGTAAITLGTADEAEARPAPPKSPGKGKMGVRLTYLGGPTYLIEIGHFRIVSDPGFDPQGTERIEGPGHVLTKVMQPPIPVDKIGKIDLVLLSHAQHLDNLDNEGRRLLGRVKLTLTTPDSAAMKLPGKPKGLKPWESTEVRNGAGERLRITAMPAVHTSNPDLREAVGEVTGFMLEWDGQEDGALYISGDTVWIDEMNEIARKYKVGTAILHLGAANVPAVGDNYLTMSAADGVRATEVMKIKNVYPAHFEGWRHFTQGSWYIVREFEKAGLAKKLHLLKPGESESVTV